MLQTKKGVSDELRSEYKRSDFGALVRGKYRPESQTAASPIAIDAGSTQRPVSPGLPNQYNH